MALILKLDIFCEFIWSSFAWFYRPPWMVETNPKELGLGIYVWGMLNWTWGFSGLFHNKDTNWQFRRSLSVIPQIHMKFLHNESSFLRLELWIMCFINSEMNGKNRVKEVKCCKLQPFHKIKVLLYKLRFKVW